MKKEEMMKERIKMYILRCPIEKLWELKPQMDKLEEAISKCKIEAKKQQMKKELQELFDTVEKSGSEEENRLKDGTFDRRRDEFKSAHYEFYKLLKENLHFGEYKDAYLSLHLYIHKKGYDKELTDAYKGFWEVCNNPKYTKSQNMLYQSAVCEKEDILALIANDEDWNKALNAERNYHNLHLKYLKEMLGIKL